MTGPPSVLNIDQSIDKVLRLSQLATVWIHETKVNSIHNLKLGNKTFFVFDDMTISPQRNDSINSSS